jgi:hypothetical protein
VNPLRTASDADGDPLTIVAVSQPQHGRAIIKRDGTVLYPAEVNIRKTTTDTFTITPAMGRAAPPSKPSRCVRSLPSRAPSRAAR